MRKRWLALWFSLFPTATIAQPVTLAELEGYVVEARIVMDQQLRREGREFPVKFHQRLRIRFQPANVIEFEISSTSFGPRGAKEGPTIKNRALLGKVIEAKNLDGGQTLWLFDDGALTNLRTYGAAGGYKRTISFSREGGGFACNAKGSHVREEGVGRIATRSIIDNIPITVLSAKQASSACKISKGPAS